MSSWNMADNLTLDRNEDTFDGNPVLINILVGVVQSGIAEQLTLNLMTNSLHFCKQTQSQ